jgi:tripartite-type tricarboxylate transporter receptor subunit TctC
MVLNAAVAKSVQSPEFSTALANQSTEPTLMSPEQTAAFIRDEIVKWKKVVVAAGVKSE